MAPHLSRRTATYAIMAAAIAPVSVDAQTAKIWSAELAADSLRQDIIRMIDIRLRPEWVDTGVSKGAW